MCNILWVYHSVKRYSKKKVRIDYRIKIAIPVTIMLLGETGILNNIINVISSNLKYGQYALSEAEKATRATLLPSF